MDAECQVRFWPRILVWILLVGLGLFVLLFDVLNPPGPPRCGITAMSPGDVCEGPPGLGTRHLPYEDRTYEEELQTINRHHRERLIGGSVMILVGAVMIYRRVDAHRREPRPPTDSAVGMRLIPDRQWAVKLPLPGKRDLFVSYTYERDRLRLRGRGSLNGVSINDVHHVGPLTDAARDEFLVRLLTTAATGRLRPGRSFGARYTSSGDDHAP